MLNYFSNLDYVIQALIGTLFTLSFTVFGSLIVIFFKNINKNFMDSMLGMSGGVMIAASFWSLLSPAIEMASKLNMIPWIIVSIGFISGSLLLFIGDKLFYIINDKHTSVKSSNSFKRCLMLILSITLHNIPEGMVIGVAFGSIAYGIEGSNLISALILTLGIGIQNFPEGSAVSLPLRREGYSRFKSFLYGSLSGIVEPISGVIGALLVLKVRMLLPFLLSFAAGAMIYVVVEEIIPESQSNNKKDLMALFTIIGFLIMMILDIMLG